MGQRTQILLKLVDLEGNVKLKGTHLQWGFGKVMPLHFMNMIINAQVNTQWNTAFFDKYDLGGTVITEEDFEEYRPNVKDINVEDLGEVNDKFFDWQANNNGGMVIEVTQADKYEEKIRMGFLGGREDFGEAGFSYYMSPKDYMQTFPTYCTKDFIKSFELFCKYYEVSALYETAKKLIKK